MSEENQNSIFSLFPKHISPLGNWAKEFDISVSNPQLLITEISGPKEISVGEICMYSIIKFNSNDNKFPLLTLGIKWGYSIDEGSIIAIDKKDQKENSIIWKIPKAQGKKIKVFAWFEGTTVSASFESSFRIELDRKLFFQEISNSIIQKKELTQSQKEQTPFIDGLSAIQIDGLNEILNKKESAYPNLNNRQLAYILATIYHETAQSFQPMKEKGSDKYLQGMYDPVLGKNETRRQMAINNGNVTEGDGIKYCGKGYAQTTWKNNYKYIGKKLGFDLIENPDLLITNHNLSLIVTFEGMKQGWFTRTTKLDDYINDNKTDWINARRIINGTNEADKIAKIAKNFYNAIIKASIPKYLKPNNEESNSLRKP